MTAFVNPRSATKIRQSGQFFELCNITSNLTSDSCSTPYLGYLSSCHLSLAHARLPSHLAVKAWHSGLLQMSPGPSHQPVAAVGMSAVVAVEGAQQPCHCDAEDGDLGEATRSGSGARCDEVMAEAASEEMDQSLVAVTGAEATAGVSELGCLGNQATAGPANGETGTSVAGVAEGSWDYVEQEILLQGVTVAAGGAVAAKLAEAWPEVVNPWERIASVAAGGNHRLQDRHQDLEVQPQHSAAAAAASEVADAAVSVAKQQQPADGTQTQSSFAGSQAGSLPAAVGDRQAEVDQAAVGAFQTGQDNPAAGVVEDAETEHGFPYVAVAAVVVVAAAAAVVVVAVAAAVVAAAVAASSSFL